MKIAACAFPMSEDLAAALSRMLEYSDEAIASDCELIIFPEAALGGLGISGEFQKDVHKCLQLNSPELNTLRQKAIAAHIGIGFGFLEHRDGCIYDSYILFDSRGDTALHYRRISDGWLPSDFESSKYGCGERPGIADTIYGKMGVLLCGDLFYPELLAKVAKEKPDLVLHPMYRAYPYRNDIQQEWDNLEFPFYLSEYAKFTATLMVCNILDSAPDDKSPYPGGAWIIKGGQMIQSTPLLKAGLLITDY